MRFLRRSLRTRLLTFFLLVAVVPIAVTGYLAYNSGRQSIVKGVKSHLHSVAILKEQEIENWVQNMEDNMTWLAASPQVSSNTAVEKARRNNFDIILLDMKMPMLNGLETYLAIRGFRPNMVAIIITGYAKETSKLIEQALQKAPIPAWRSR